MSTLIDAPLLSTYPATELTLVRGEGAWDWDIDGNAYLDFAAGIAVVGLGHGHPAPLAAAHAQLDALWHCSNLYGSEPAAALATRLAARFAGSKAFLCNSGAEAVEAALKLARKATGRTGVVALEGGFHGRTAGALSVTGQPAKRTPFEPLLPGVTFIPANDVDALLAAVTDEVGLVLLETVQGEGGVHPLTPAFLQAARSTNALLCLDEIQCGLGRTGTFFAFEQAGVEPDLVTVAKGLANGLPIGALLSRVDAFTPGDHGSTFGGNPVACAAACAVLDAIDDDLLASVRASSSMLVDGLEALPGVLDVRGAGLLLGIELDRPAAPVVAAAREAGLLVLSAGESVLRLTPPLTIGEPEVAAALASLAEALA